VLSARRLTCEVVADLLTQTELAEAPIHQVHYRGEGRKAAQVNYAVAQLHAVRDHDYVAVYDVDSRPDLTLLRRTVAYVAARHRADGQLPPVVQHLLASKPPGPPTRRGSGTFAAAPPGSRHCGHCAGRSLRFAVTPQPSGGAPASRHRDH
jgi:hypothetical protein